MAPKKPAEGFTFTPSIAPIGSTGADNVGSGRKAHDPKSWNNGVADSVRDATLAASTSASRTQRTQRTQAPKLFNTPSTSSKQVKSLPKYANTSAVSSNPAKDANKNSTKKSTSATPIASRVAGSSTRVTQTPNAQANLRIRSVQEQVVPSRRNVASERTQQQHRKSEAFKSPTSQNRVASEVTPSHGHESRNATRGPGIDQTPRGASSISSKVAEGGSTRGQWGNPEGGAASTVPAALVRQPSPPQAVDTANTGNDAQKSSQGVLPNGFMNDFERNFDRNFDRNFNQNIGPQEGVDPPTNLPPGRLPRAPWDPPPRYIMNDDGSLFLKDGHVWEVGTFDP